jgi:hypothetical protein
MIKLGLLNIKNGAFSPIFDAAIYYLAAGVGAGLISNNSTSKVNTELAGIGPPPCSP